MEENTKFDMSPLSALIVSGLMASSGEQSRRPFPKDEAYIFPSLPKRMC